MIGARELLALRYALDERGRMLGTNEPPPRGPAPRFAAIDVGDDRAWAVRVDVDAATAARVAELAARGAAADEIATVLGGRTSTGPTFSFGVLPPRAEAVVDVHAFDVLARFRGWTRDELPDRQPIVAICDGDTAVSVCFCARRSATAAEAGVETVAAYRGRGYAAMVTTAWARAVRDSGRTPIYSTSATNTASLAVARKLGLVARASELEVVDPP